MFMRTLSFHSINAIDCYIHMLCTRRFNLFATYTVLCCTSHSLIFISSNLRDVCQWYKDRRLLIVVHLRNVRSAFYANWFHYYYLLNSILWVLSRCHEMSERVHLHMFAFGPQCAGDGGDSDCNRIIYQSQNDVTSRRIHNTRWSLFFFSSLAKHCHLHFY